MADLQTLPYVDIQHDALAVFDDVSQGVVAQENVWVSAYKLGETSIHGKLTLSREGEGIQGVDIKCPTEINVQRKSHIPLSINTIDISPDGSQLVYGGPDGYCYVHPLSHSTLPPLELKGHVGDVLDVKWFPSGSVVLTASTDSTIRIFSSVSGINPRTLKGHKRAVTTLGILGVGKNVVSGSKDGTVKLWDVSKGVCLTSFYTEGFAGVEKIATGNQAQVVRNSTAVRADTTQDQFQPKHLDGEIVADTHDKLLFAGLSSSTGSIALYDIASKQPIFTAFPHIPASTGASLTNFAPSASGGAIHSVAYDADRFLLASGSAKGVVVVRDVRMLDKDGSGALHIFRRTEAPINDLAFVGPASSDTSIDLVLAPESGLPCRIGIPHGTGEPVTCVEEYAGWEPLSIESVSVGREGQVWVAGAEGGIRRY
ncbi:hypothetical protein QFC22_002774 [Naganishia vaughanmartiniae]|uniref:Uncharacterized protein n=1 Tax=Naganishia vaughanmartiniae TaxID=1424756 RepID=A0ACC2XBS3_9TREE|nr:hypothetical protein QFC22_002774 [Naganishia vaughanmartiniae]